MFGIDSRFEYPVGDECGSARIRDKLPGLSGFYPSDYYCDRCRPRAGPGVASGPLRGKGRGKVHVLQTGRHHGRGRDDCWRRQVHTLISILRSVRLAELPRGADSSVLDVGCGCGMPVSALGLTRLSHVVGVDPYLPDERRLETGGWLRRQPLGQVEGRFDLVMFHHSLEHVPGRGFRAPRREDHARRPRAILVRMPTVRSWAFERYGPDWSSSTRPHTSLRARRRRGWWGTGRPAHLRVRDDSTASSSGERAVLAGVPS